MSISRASRDCTLLLHGLGIIPVIMVMLAYVKRETGKYEDARRLNKYSEDVSAVSLIVFAIFLFCVVLYLISACILHKVAYCIG